MRNDRVFMSKQHASLPLSNNAANEQPYESSRPPVPPPLGNGSAATRFSPFWKDRLFEGALVLSMALYYLIGNPLLSLPFLLVFAALSWYRLSFAIALLPLSLPYYLQQKVVAGDYRFSPAEITLAICVIVALIQLLLKREHVRSWTKIRGLVGPFALPILVFLGFAALSIGIAYTRATALRAFREEVLDPLLYLALALVYLRSRQDVVRLLGTLVATGLIVTLLGLGQYFLFRNTLVVEADGVQRVHAFYGSANSIGLLFDYILPIPLAWMLARVDWKHRLIALIICVPMFVVLYLTRSLGAWVGMAVATVFVLALSIRNRKVLLIAGLVALVALLLVLAFRYADILNYVVGRHADQNGTGTAIKRIYLWQSALAMIRDSPWLGYGMDNWLCHYSQNSICSNNLQHYWILKTPTGRPTGLGDEPLLSHPHNIFLHVWVSMGVFGLLAFVCVLTLFYWLFTRILLSLRSIQIEKGEQLRWMTLGIGGAMLAALVQGQVDSAFLEQDLAFCFWALVAALLLMRMLSRTPWRGTRPLDPQT